MVDKKTKFRARKLDYSRSLKVVNPEELVGEETGDSLMDGSPVRTAPLVSTGVDKEEEEEEHLQAALTSALVVPKAQSYVIPTPHVEELRSNDWEPLYRTLPKKRKGEEPAMMMLSEGYCGDEEDFGIAQDLGISLDTLEKLFEAWEDASQRLSIKSVTAAMAPNNSNLPEEALNGALTKWQEKKQTGRLMLGSLRHEDLDKIGADPYVCFRRRELKLPRKTRRSDAQCVEKLRKMRYELEALTTGLEMLVRRDEWRRSGLEVEGELFQQYRRLPAEERNKVPSYKTAISRRASERENSRRKLIQMTPLSGGMHPLHKPYFPSLDVSAQIVQEIEGLMSRVRLPTLSDDDDGGEGEYYGHEGVVRFDKVQARVRRGRSGRILVDPAIEEKGGEEDQFLPFPTGASFNHKSNKGKKKNTNDIPCNNNAIEVTTPLLTLKECAQLNNAAVGNYNQHYLSASNGLLMPYSFFHWVTLSNEHGLAPSTTNNNTNPTANNNNNSNNKSSPNKKQKTTTTSAISSTTTKLTGGNNITVKVKTRSSLEGSGDSGSSSPYQQQHHQNNHQNHQQSHQQQQFPTQNSQPAQAQFTPTGLYRSNLDNISNAGGSGNKT